MNRLGEIAAKLPQVMDEAVKEAAQEIARNAATNIEQHVTGELRASLLSPRAVRKVPRKQGGGYGVYADWYWHFVEYGTFASPEKPAGWRTIPSAAKPFLTPAGEMGRAKLQNQVAKKLRNL